MKINYFFAEACQNSFVFVDLLHQAAIQPSQSKQIHQRLINTHCDDALILLNGKTDQKGAYLLEMQVLGIDGKLGAFCGNGARTCAAYMFKYYPEFQRFFIHDPFFKYELLKYSETIYAVQLPAINFIPYHIYAQGPRILKEAEHFKYEFDNKTFYYADATEPHLILNATLGDAELTSLSQHINKDTATFPLGINITVYEIETKDHLHVKTYERGAQRITPSCGTGATCAAGFYLNGREGVVMVTNPGGILTLTHRNNQFELKGPASLRPSTTLKNPLA